MEKVPPAGGYAAAVDLDLSQDAGQLTASLVDVESVSGGEKPLADAIEAALHELPHLSVHRDGNALVARTGLGRPQRVVLAGHIDTVPVAGNLPSHAERGTLFGCGTTDMKSGVAVQLRLAASVPQPSMDVTYVFYDCEEVASQRNGLLRLSRQLPRAAGRRFRRADGTDGLRGRGRLPGHAAGRDQGDGKTRAQREVMDGAQRHPCGRTHPRRAA